MLNGLDLEAKSWRDLRSILPKELFDDGGLPGVVETQDEET